MEDIYKCGMILNQNWEDNWKDIISTDQDYDGDFLIRLIVHKLKLMADYFRGLLESTGDKDEIKNLVGQIDECYNIGIKILTFEYGKEADIIFEKYGNPDWLVSEPSDENYTAWNNLSDLATKARQSDIESLFSLLGKNVNNWWV